MWGVRKERKVRVAKWVVVEPNAIFGTSEFAVRRIPVLAETRTSSDAKRHQSRTDSGCCYGPAGSRNLYMFQNPIVLLIPSPAFLRF